MLFIMTGTIAGAGLGLWIVRTLSAWQLTQGDEPSDRSFRQLFISLCSTLAGVCRQVVGPKIEGIRLQRTEVRLRSVGVDLPDAAVGYLFLKGLCLPIALLLFSVLLGIKLASAHAFLLVLMCWCLPDLVLRILVQSRCSSIERDLPFVLDMLTMSVEAGSDLSQALGRVVRSMGPGALQEELISVERGLRMGMAKAQAFSSLARMQGVPSLSLTVTMLLQAERMGVGVGQVLRSMSLRLRRSRLVRAEREGAKATQKLIFPLVCCILPVTFVIVLGPLFVRVKLGGVEALFHLW